MTKRRTCARRFQGSNISSTVRDKEARTEQEVLLLWCCLSHGPWPNNTGYALVRIAVNAKRPTTGFTTRSKSSYAIFISSLCEPALNEISLS